LLTDFGLSDSYVAEMKARVLSDDDGISILDISHDVLPGNIPQAGYLLWRSFCHFPVDTVFLTVVDPGVGSDRRILLLELDSYRFVAPDNGVLSLIAREPTSNVYDLRSRIYTDSDSSATFEGRDIMAPICAQILSSGTPAGLQKCGDMRRVEILCCETSNSSLRGEVLHIDRFGNVITTIEDTRLPRERGLHLCCGIAKLDGLSRTYSSVAKGEALAYIGSCGLLEFAVNGSSFAEQFEVAIGEEVKLGW